MNNKPISRKENIVVQELDGEVLIYDLKDNKAFCLNETSALVWQMCDGEKSVGEISRELSKKLKTPANEDLVWLALDQLKQENLIENEVKTPAAFEGMNRRDVIKKVGLASMIALPIVSGMVAPTAAHAVSPALIRGARGTCTGQGAGGPGTACTSNSDCGVDNQNNAQCCRNIANAGVGNQTCITTANAGNQCDC